jgi:hypothetical protein
MCVAERGDIPPLQPHQQSWPPIEDREQHRTRYPPPDLPRVLQEDTKTFNNLNRGVRVVHCRRQRHDRDVAFGITDVSPVGYLVGRERSAIYVIEMTREVQVDGKW